MFSSDGAPGHDPRAQVMDELDLALVHALQINARAPWAKVAGVLGVDASTVARRWAGLVEARDAWFTVWPSPLLHGPRTDAALVRIERPVSPDAMRRWCQAPWTVSVERTSRGVLVMALGRSGLADLEARIVDLLQVDSLRADLEFAAAVPVDDSQWQLRVLSASQQRALRTPSSPALPRPAEEPVVAHLTDLLRTDARMSYSAIAEALGVSESTARRTLDRLVTSGLVRVGVDVAMPSVGLGRGVVLRGRQRSATAEVPTHPAVHRMLELVGPAPLTISCRMTSLTHLGDIEQQWQELVEITDRWTVTASLKRNGHLIGADGRVEGAVPVAW